MRAVDPGGQHRTPPPWQSVGSTAWSLSVVRRTFADPRPALSEATLVAAHDAGCAALQAPDLCVVCPRSPCPYCSHDGAKPKPVCTCHPAVEERHTLAEWDAIEARQRAFAANAALVDAEGREIATLLRRKT